MRTLRTAGLAALLAAGSVVAIAPLTDAAPPTDDPVTAAGYGARWLAGQVEPGGYVEGPGGTPAPAATINVALALAATGVETEVLDSTVDWLADEVETVIVVGADDDAGRLGALLMIVVAVGEDPTSFGGVDLVARLEGTLGDFSPGLYGASDPTYDGAYRQALALLGLEAAGAATPTVGLDWLAGQQCAGAPASATGAWLAYRADTSQPCPAPDPNTFTGPDTNQTALAMEALAAWGRTPTEDPLPFLASAQVPDGGFAYYPGQGIDVNSTALVIQALLAVGADLGDWATPEGDPLSSLLAWQIGCEAPDDEIGAFASTWSEGAPDSLATQQAVPAVALAPFPLDPVVPVATPIPCEPATTTTTGAPGSTSTASTPSTAAASTSTVAASVRTTGAPAAVATPTYAG